MKLYNPDNTLWLDIEVDDESYRNKQLMGENVLELHYSMTKYKEMPVGVYCEFEGERYTLESPHAFKVQSDRNYEYTATLYGAQSHLKKYRVRDTTIQNKLKFSYTATPLQHLQLLVKNMNRRESGWTVGSCIEATEATVSYNHTNCLEALQQIANEFSTEWEIDGKTIHLRRVEYNKNAPLALHYGKDGGFLPGVGRENYGDSRPVEILFVQGGSRNIDGLKYGATELLMPKSQRIKYDGNHFEGEAGFDAAHAREYTTDADGVSVQRADKSLVSYNEDSVDLSDIYPSRVGTVSAVETKEGKDTEGNAATFYDILDSSIPEALNFENHLIEGETMTVVFQSGKLTGREFDVKYKHAERRFEIVPATIDGAEMPSAVFAPQIGDKYAVFGCMLPDAYICDNATKSGASWDLFREAVRTLYANEDVKYTFIGELDGIYAAKHWIEIGGKIKVGGYVLFTSEKFLGADGILIRQTGIKTYVNKPKKPVIELSNQATSGTSIAAALDKIGQEEVLREDSLKSLRHFTKRTYADAKEMQDMLEKALGNFSPGIDPVWVRTMSVIVGNEYQQFEFVDNKTDSQHEVIPNFAMDNSSKVFTAPEAILKHCTLGIENASSAHKASEYKYWDMAAYTSPALSDSAKAYYLTAKCSKNGTTGTFLLQENYAYDPGDGYYYFLVGVVSSERDGERSFATCYGFTEVLPGQMRIKMIVSPDGRTYFNVSEGVIGGEIHIQSGSSGYENFIDKPDLTQYSTKADLKVLGDRITANVQGIVAINGRVSKIENAGFLTTAQGNTLYASKQMEKGEYIISRINQDPGNVTINANKINLNGAVTFSSLNQALLKDLNSRLKSGQITLNDFHYSLRQYVDRMSSDIASKVSSSALKAFALNGQPGISKNDLQNALKTELDNKINGRVTTQGDKLADIIVNGKAFMVGGYIQADYINTKNLTVSDGATVGDFKIHSGQLIWKDNPTPVYGNPVGTYIRAIGFMRLLSPTHKRGIYLFGNEQEHGDNTSLVELERSTQGRFIYCRYSTGGSTREFEISIKNTGDDDWYKRVCIRATVLPHKNAVGRMPAILNSIHSSSPQFWEVLWDARSGCFCLGQRY